MLCFFIFVKCTISIICINHVVAKSFPIINWVNFININTANLIMLQIATIGFPSSVNHLILKLQSKQFFLFIVCHIHHLFSLSTLWTAIACCYCFCMCNSIMMYCLIACYHFSPFSIMATFIIAIYNMLVYMSWNISSS